MQSPWLQGRNLKALYGVPLVYEGDVIGVAHIGSRTAEGFSEPERRLFVTMAERAAWVVSRKSARERLYAVLHEAPALISIWRRALMPASSGPISVRDAKPPADDFVCELANEEYRRHYAGREVLGRTCAEHGLGESMRALFDRVVAEGQTLSFDEYPIRADFGGKGQVEDRFFNLSLHPLRDALGRPDSVLSFAVDLTPQVRARLVIEQSERERAELLELERAARREAEIANRSKDEFLATVSHELRTPLNAILGWTASARRGIVKDMGRALGIIERNARAQARIIEDVLDLSRIVSGKLRLEIVPSDIARALFGAVEAVRPAAEAKGVTLDVQVEDNLGVVHADEGRVQQIVWNLLANGVKFTPQGGSVMLSAERAARSIRIAVTDTGEGIAPDFLAHVFEPFRQADGSTTRRHGGLGLGLAIVHQLCQAHGGTIRVDSEGAGKGARFEVELPTRPAPIIERPPLRREAAPVLVDASAAQLDDVRVLVIDDEEDVRSLVGAVLERHGGQVELAGSSTEALERLRHFRPHVVVTDIGMPEADGYTFLRMLRALPKDDGGETPAIALTAYARAEDREQAAQAGFEVHIAKPVDPLELVSTVARVAKGESPRTRKRTAHR